jgi:hypothetical protein
VTRIPVDDLRRLRGLRGGHRWRRAAQRRKRGSRTHPWNPLGRRIRGRRPVVVHTGQPKRWWRRIIAAMPDGLTAERNRRRRPY